MNGNNIVPTEICFVKPGLISDITRKGYFRHEYRHGPSETILKMSECLNSKSNNNSTEDQCCGNHQHFPVQVRDVVDFIIDDAGAGDDGGSGSSFPPRLNLFTSGFETIDLGASRKLIGVLQDLDSAAQGLKSSSLSAIIPLIQRYFVGRPMTTQAGDVMIPLQVLGPVLRSVRPGMGWPESTGFGGDSMKLNGATLRAHIDTDPSAVWYKRFALYPHGTWSPLSVVNLWIPTRPLVARPVAFVDRRTVDLNDMILTDFESSVYGWVNMWNLAHNPNQKWYWDSDMGTHNAAILYPGSDSWSHEHGHDEGATHFQSAQEHGIRAWLFDTTLTPHGSFKLPGEDLLVDIGNALRRATVAIEKCYEGSRLENEPGKECNLSSCQNSLAGLHDLVSNSRNLDITTIPNPVQFHLAKLAEVSQRLTCHQFSEEGHQDHSIDLEMFESSLKNANSALSGLVRSSLEMRIIVFWVSKWTCLFALLIGLLCIRIFRPSKVLRTCITKKAKHQKMKKG